jgi:ATP-dependent exoDNAse (exonuclease V) beta subunit
VDRWLRVSHDLPVQPVTGLAAPGGRTFTPEQAEAILDDGGELLLSAAAGSGKTSVLVERFVRHVREQAVSPGNILAITFTEKAAGELRARIRARFLELGLRDAAREAEGAWISTVHGFCARLLRAHSVAAGLDPGFSVLDETTARSLRERAWDEAFAAWLDDRGAPALDLSASFGADALRGAITEIHDALRSSGDTVPRLPLPAPAPLPDRGVLLRAREAAALALAGEKDGKTLARALDALARCGEAFAALDGDALPDAATLETFAFKGRLKAFDDEAPARYREVLAAYTQACANHRGAHAAAELDVLLGGYAGAYAAGKRARSALDFDDLELLARDLLRETPSIRATYAERFARIMVDEFQDSNPLQVELFGLLDRGNVFVVGDELQSIYGFRHADVDVFRRRRASLQDGGRALALTRNFRSRPEVVDAVNGVFAARFGADSGLLVAGRGDEGTPAAPRVELLLTEQEGWDDVDLGELPRTLRWRQAEARLVAQRIRDLVDGGEAAPEDVVVLLRATSDMPVFERALEDQGLQTLAAGGRGYWGRQVVRDLCAWLAALANPRDEEQLYGVLASPLVGVSTDALALVSEAGRGNVWRLLERVFVLDEDPADLRGRLFPEDRERLAAFAARFAAERELAPRLALDTLLRRAIEASEYDLHVLRLPGGARRLANVHKLLGLAAEHERTHGRDVRGLVDRANAELEADARETDAPVELGDAKAVRLMTIHAAKGLEFPVVVVADLGRGYGYKSESPALLVRDGRLGLRLTHFDGQTEACLDHKELVDEARQRAAEEEDRILYVALTRAEERLIMSGGLKLASWPEKLGFAAPVGWLAPAVLGAGGLPGEDEPDVELDAPFRLRVARSSPATVGRVLREQSLAPAGAHLPIAPPPPVSPPLPAPAAPGPAVRSLSYTSLGLWRTCGYRYYLTRVLRLPDDGLLPAAPAAPAAAGLGGRVRGVLVHEALERLDARTDDDAAIRELLVASATRNDATPTDRELDDLGALVTAFAGTPLAARIAHAERVRREHRFAIPLSGTLLTGAVDVLATEADGTALVVDYKTDRVPHGDLAAHAEQHYGVQRRAYALAALRDGAPRVDVAYAFLERPGEPQVTRYEAEDADGLTAELLDLASGALSGRFEVTQEPSRDVCAGCPGRRALCPHGLELTGRAPEPAPA